MDVLLQNYKTTVLLIKCYREKSENPVGMFLQNKVDK